MAKIILLISIIERWISERGAGEQCCCTLHLAFSSVGHPEHDLFNKATSTVILRISSRESPKAVL